MTAPAFIDELIEEQRDLTAVERFARWHDSAAHSPEARSYHKLLPQSAPAAGQQYAFEVDLDKCSGCKACVTACHSLNGLDEDESWRAVGMLVAPAGRKGLEGSQQHVTTACHHCVDPGCMNGCPVLAYDKDPVTGIVRHLDDQCIGCSYCVMKCPYEVPRYSNRLGIVRKCDMCSNRLAVGEAPACVQSCPNEAIRITVVDQLAIRETYAAADAGRFLPDSPDPSITLPTTRYLTSREGAGSLVAADNSAPRLDHAHWPLVIMLLLTQAAAGSFLVAGVLANGSANGNGPVVKWLGVAGGGCLVLGLMASVLHLGQPLKAWRAFLGWRRSWLSREILAFNAFAGIASLAVAAQFLSPAHAAAPVLMLGAGMVGLGSIGVSAMVYVDTRRPFWAARYTFEQFLGTSALLGLLIATAIAAWNIRGAGDPILTAQALAIGAIGVRVGLFASRLLALGTALANESSPVHLNARTIREKLGWTVNRDAQLCGAVIALEGMALVTGVSWMPWLATGALVAGLASELVNRYVFFVAGGARRMPGGVPT